MVIANRSLRARANPGGGTQGLRRFDCRTLDEELAAADIVVSCTASPVPLITKQLAANAACARAAAAGRSSWSISPCRATSSRRSRDLEDIYLFSIDDLQQLVDENRQQREMAAGSARLLIDEEVARFLAESRAHDAGPAIRALRPKPRRSASRPWSRRGACSQPAGPRDEVIDYLANTLTNRLLHSPDPRAAAGRRILRSGARGGDRPPAHRRSPPAISPIAARGRYNPRP